MHTPFRKCVPLVPLLHHQSRSQLCPLANLRDLSFGSTETCGVFFFFFLLSSESLGNEEKMVDSAYPVIPPCLVGSDSAKSLLPSEMSR